MVALFLDANFFIDIVEKRREVDQEVFVGKRLYISALSVHVLTYLYKYKMPSERLQNILEGNFSVVNFTDEIVGKSLKGPTDDFEDNVQLHSAAEAECDFFLTEDKKLLYLKFFGKSRVVSDLKTA